MVLLATFVVVVVIQVVHRLAGAIASLVWTVGLFGYGFYLLNGGAQIVFLGVRVQMWHFVTFMACMLAYNTWVFVRVLKHSRR